MDYPELLERLAREPELATQLLNLIMPSLRDPRDPRYRRQGAVPVTPALFYDVAEGELPLVLAAIPADVRAAEAICDEKLTWRTESPKDDRLELIGVAAGTPRVRISVDPGGQALTVLFIEAPAAR
jgi:hypothetical protein